MLDATFFCYISAAITLFAAGCGSVYIILSEKSELDQKPQSANGRLFAEIYTLACISTSTAHLLIANNVVLQRAMQLSYG